MFRTQRRDVLRGLGSLALLSMASCFKGSTDDKPVVPAEPAQLAGSCPGPGDGPEAPDGTLNVIFHGPFCFVLYPDHLEAITPAAAGHVYGAGTWRKEYFMAKGVYYLRGVANQKLQATREDAKIKFASELVQNIDPQSASYCKLILPVPSAITPLGLFVPPANPKLFVGKNADDANKISTLGTVHSCTYYKVEKKNLELSESVWYPEVNCLKSINLHIIATSVFQLDMDHSVRTFHSLVEMLPGLSIDMNRAAAALDFEYKDPDCSKWPGILRDEQLPLHSTLSLEKPICNKLVPPRICDAPSAFVTQS